MRKPGNRLLGPGYALALRVFADAPATWREVAARCNVNRQTAQLLCHGFRRQGLTHIVEWRRVRVDSRHYLAPVYALGDGDDVPNPAYLHGSQARTRPELLAFCQVVRELQQGGPWHAAGLARHLGCSPTALRATMRRLHELRLTRIEEYRPRHGGGPAIAYTGWGPDMRDTPRPAPQSPRELSKRHNKVAYARQRQIKLLHAMVRGVAVTGRKAAANDALEAA